MSKKSKKKKRTKLEPMGDITYELELVLEKMTDPDGHDMQHGEVMAQVYNWLKIHALHAQETYSEDESHPVHYYGHYSGLK